MWSWISENRTHNRLWNYKLPRTHKKSGNQHLRYLLVHNLCLIGVQSWKQFCQSVKHCLQIINRVSQQLMSQRNESTIAENLQCTHHQSPSPSELSVEKMRYMLQLLLCTLLFVFRRSMSSCIRMNANQERNHYHCLLAVVVFHIMLTSCQLQVGLVLSNFEGGHYQLSMVLISVIVMHLATSTRELFPYSKMKNYLPRGTSVAWRKTPKNWNSWIWFPTDFTESHETLSLIQFQFFGEKSRPSEAEEQSVSALYISHT